jgi:ribonuclease VapC
LIVADTSALIALLMQEAEAAVFLRTIIRSRECLIAAPTALEFIMVAQGDRLGRTTVETEALLAKPRFRIVPWSDTLVAVACNAFLTYGKGRHPAGLNFGDCMSYALAKSLDAPLLYKGEDFAKTDIRSAV